MVVCEICGGIGLVRTHAGSAVCVCQAEREILARMNRAGFPAQYEEATLENLHSFSANMEAIALAKRFAQEFVRKGPPGARRGILLTGGVGRGKTHLAIALGRLLVVTKGITVKFVDCQSLYDRIRASYNDQTLSTQGRVLRELTQADLVILDDLGAARPTDWVYEVTELLIGELYNRRAAVIVTSNFPNLSPGEGTSTYERLRPSTLGDRIGARMWSRLQQMCVHVEMAGPDYRNEREHGTKGSIHLGYGHRHQGAARDSPDDAEGSGRPDWHSRKFTQ